LVPLLDRTLNQQQPMTTKFNPTQDGESGEFNWRINNSMPSLRTGGSKKKTNRSRQAAPSSSTTAAAARDVGMGQAHELAKAKIASSAYQKKRKSPTTKRDEIFRSRDVERRDKPEPQSNSFSRFLSSHQGNLVTALCFATPVHDEEEPNEILKTESDCNTLNTAEDTITSTLFFERKYAHIVEHRPPMPLFSDFKVEDDQNELRRIVASDSHNSMKMIRLMGEHGGLATTKVTLEESEEEDDVCQKNKDDDVPPAIKIDSSASSSSSSRR
jgi:hypothetical protein